MANNFLFIYGTLLEVNNEFALYLKNNSILCSAGKFKGKLYDIGEYPGAIEDDISNYYVHGSILLLTDTSALKQIDFYEGYNPKNSKSNLYTRKLVPVANNEGVIECWIYLYNQPVTGLTQITSGNYLQYINQKKSPNF